MSFIQWLGDWLRKVSTSVKSITAGTNSLTYIKHNNDTVTIPLTLESDLYVKKTGDTVTGNINSLYGVNGIETVNQFSGEMAGNDLWAIRTGITGIIGNPDPLGWTGSTTTDNGFLEIATADNGTEPIYISQYVGDHTLPDSQGIRFYQQVRRATLLDEQGNTVFPGTVTAVNFNGNATSANRATNATYATSAGTASKLGSIDVGSATQPIYLDDGVATACTYQLHKTVPSDAVFTDTIYTHPTYTARTGKPTQDQTPAFGNTVTVSQVESDGTGHVTGMTDRTITIPATEASSSGAGLMSAADKVIIDNLDVTYAKITGTLVDNAITRTSSSNHTFGIQHGYDPGNEGEICNIGWDFSNRDGAMLGLNSASHPTLAGRFSLIARDGTDSSELQGLPNGTLTWNSKTVLTTANGLSLSGGKLTSGNSSIQLYPSGGIEISTPLPYIDFHHANSSTDYSARIINSADGQLQIIISDDSSVSSKVLTLKSDGTLTWGGKNVATIQTGTWTPVLKGYTVAGTFTYSSRSGQYYKIGKMVFIFGNIQISNYGTYPTGTVAIDGLPFISSAALTPFGITVAGFSGGVDNSFMKLVNGYINSNSTVLICRSHTKSSPQNISNANWSSSSTSGNELMLDSTHKTANIYIAGYYFTN